jgi:phage gp46-like protein
MDPAILVDGQFSLVLNNGQTENDAELTNAVILSIFGGNRDGSQYWGYDADEGENNFQTELAKTTDFEAGAPALRSCILLDLKWLLDDGIASELDARVEQDSQNTRRLNIWIAVMLSKDSTVKIIRESVEAS